MTENLTVQTVDTTNWYSGDDGIYAPIEEASLFLEKRMNGEILSEETFSQMTSWNNEKNPDYGLGLETTAGFPFHFLMGHSGSGIGMRRISIIFQSKILLLKQYVIQG